MRPVARNTDFGVPDTNQAVQPQEMIRCQEFHICTYSENKGADQL